MSPKVSDALFDIRQRNIQNPAMLLFKKFEIIQTSTDVREWSFSPDLLLYSLNDATGKMIFEINVVSKSVLDRTDDSILPNLKDFSIPRLGMKLGQERTEMHRSITVDKSPGGENCLVIISMQRDRHVHCRKRATPVLGIDLPTGICILHPSMINDNIWAFRNPTELAIIMQPGSHVEMCGPKGTRTLRYTGLNELLRTF